MIILLEDFNAEVETENIFKPTIGNESLHQDSDDNDVRKLNIATLKNLTYLSRGRCIHTETFISTPGPLLMGGKYRRTSYKEKKILFVLIHGAFLSDYQSLSSWSTLVYNIEDYLCSYIRNCDIRVNRGLIQFLYQTRPSTSIAIYFSFSKSFLYPPFRS
jgi:hypothetical protein